MEILRNTMTPILTGTTHTGVIVEIVFAVLNSIGTSFSTSRNVHNSSGPFFLTPISVLNSSGRSFDVI